MVIPAHNQPHTLSIDETLHVFGTHEGGLTSGEVLHNHQQYGLNILTTKKNSVLSILIRQVKDNPLIIILSIATAISYLLGETTSSYYIFWMIFISIALGFWNEFFAEKTIDTLMKRVSLNAVVIRNDEKLEIPTSQVTLGDVVLLTTGSIVPADMRIIEAKHLEINESALTGESKTVAKHTSPQPKTLPLLQAANMAFMGSVVESGWGKGVVTTIGKNTEFGKISESVSFLKPETAFQQGLTQFGNLLIKVVIILTIAIFAVNSLLNHPLLDSVLFALAIAVGLTPELLPVIVTISLSHGAHKLLKKEVLVKQLIAIENLGNMDVLCTDKTGTLTEGRMQLVHCVDCSCHVKPELMHYALLCNAAVVHHKIIGDAIDTAIWEYAHEHKIVLGKQTEKMYEEPLNFEKRAMFTVIKEQHNQVMIVKGAPETIIAHSNTNHSHPHLLEEFSELSKSGYRVVALAQKHVESKSSYSWKDVTDLEFLGFLTFADIPKKTAKTALERLANLNVIVKVITGDNELVTAKICQEVGMGSQKIATGSELEALSQSELQGLVNTVNIFARVSPEQKLMLVQALRDSGHTVGYMGDGINDAPSLYSADVGISVDDAVDVAKNAASIVLLKKSLDVIAEGIIEGRKIFNNTIKYILMGTSSNFGNMFSAAGASFVLPFLPMQPLQILLNNSLYDISQMTIPSDNVDAESLVKPRHWNLDFIKRYMIFFGPISSLYDFLTFGLMYYGFGARDALFQTGWFIESLATQVLVVFVIRTARTPFFTSKPGKWLTLTCCGIVSVAVLLPYTPLGQTFGFVPLPPLYFAVLALLVGTYIGVVEISKKFFLKKFTL